MSDTDTSTTTDEPKAEDAEAEDQPTQTDADSQEETDKDEAWDPERAKRKISKVNSENKALRDRATKAEKKAESVDELTRTNTDLSTANLRLEVGYELGLPLSLAKRLQGSTREEMLTDAESLVELVAPTKKPGTRRPAEDLRGGGAPNEEPEETDVSKLGDRMFRR